MVKTIQNIIACLKITHNLILCYWIKWRYRVFEKYHNEYGNGNILLPAKKFQASANVWINMFETKVTLEGYFD